ncbi:MAG: magnesium transporter [Halothiobacillaceae bacterium]
MSEFTPHLLQFLDDGDRSRLAEAASRAHAADIADAIEQCEPSCAAELLGCLPPTLRAEVFGHIEPGYQTRIVEVIDHRELAVLVTHMEADERADLYKQIPESLQETLLSALEVAEREDLCRLSAHPEGTVGSIMTSEYAALPPDLLARQAIARLRDQAPDKETIYQIFIVDGARRLVGTLSLRELILAQPDTPIRDVMRTEVISIPLDAPSEEAARKVSNYDLIALPVIDERNRMVGIVTHDDAMDVAEQEATEDFHKAGGAQNIGMSLRDASVGLLFRKRIVWLVILVFVNLLSGAGIAFYEQTISTYIVLVFFLPLLIASGGNAGAQSATLMVRALATGDVGAKDWGMMLGKELFVALLLSGLMAFMVAGVGWIRGGEEIALIVAVAMIAIVVVASLVGMSLPFLLTRFGFDPAAASVPLVTSVADVLGVLVYFSMASLVLGLG